MSTINREKIARAAGHIVVLKGGDSVEREISLISGDAVFKGLQRLGVKSTTIDVGENIITDLEQAKPDLVFIMLHGKGGEDGVIQGLLEIMKLPYTGSGVLASALAMDKVKSKLIWQKLDLNTADFMLLEKDSDWQAVIDRFGETVVKPVNGGSSLGIALVNDAESLKREYENAITFDSTAMAEKCIQGKEFSVGVLQEQLLPTIQLETDRQFFDYDAKYVDKETRYICPPELSEAKHRELEHLVRAAYDCLGCEGLARVDLMQDKNEVFYLLELNTVPGMTPHSFVPMAAEKVGIDFDELLLRILDAELALG